MRVEPAERGGPKGTVGVLATGAKGSFAKGSLHLRELVSSFAPSVARVSYGVPGCKLYLGTYDATRALCGTRKLLNSYQPSSFASISASTLPFVPEPLVSASFLSSAM